MNYFSVSNLGIFHDPLFSSLAVGTISFKKLTAKEAKSWLETSVFLNVTKEKNYLSAVAQKLQLETKNLQEPLPVEESRKIFIANDDQYLVVSISNLPIVMAAPEINFSEKEIAEANFCFTVFTALNVTLASRDGILAKNHFKQIINLSGYNVKVDTSPEKCLRFGFYSGQRIIDPVRRHGKVLGVGPENPNEKAREVLWYALDEKGGRAQVAAGFNNNARQLKEAGFREE